MRKKTIKTRVAVAILTAALTMSALAGCGSTSTGASGNSSTATSSVSVENGEYNASGSSIDMPEFNFEATATVGTEAEADTYITLSDSGITVDGSGVSVTGNVVTITSAGYYAFTGTLSEGQIVVDTEDDEKVRIILNGVDLTNSETSPIYVINAPKNVEIYTQEDSVNIITDARDAIVKEDTTQEDEASGDADTEDMDGAIYSKDDLKFDGKGTLYVIAGYDDGIVSKDDIEIQGGTIYVSAVGDGIRGKDSVEATDGTVYISAGADGVKSTNDSDEEKGYITIDGTTFYVIAGNDGFQAETAFTMESGTVVILAGGGSVNAPEHTDDMMMGPGMMWGDTSDTSTDMDDYTSDSYKGIKCTSSIVINGGNISIDSCDDSLHSDDLLIVNGGSIYVISGDDGVHAENNLIINDGNITVAGSYEGLEAKYIVINGGTSDITADDDGVNAAGGTDDASSYSEVQDYTASTVDSGDIVVASAEIVENEAAVVAEGNDLEDFTGDEMPQDAGELDGEMQDNATLTEDGMMGGPGGGGMGGGMQGGPSGGGMQGDMGGGMMGLQTDCTLTINGGYLAVNATGDGLDANGSIEMTGGTVIVYGPADNGNASIDYETSFTLSGGFFFSLSSNGMAEKVTGDGQSVAMFNISGKAGSTYQVVDASGNEVLTFTAVRDFSCMYLSDPDLASGTYTVYSGSYSGGDNVNGILTGGSFSQDSQITSFSL